MAKGKAAEVSLFAFFLAYAPWPFNSLAPSSLYKSVCPYESHWNQLTAMSPLPRALPSALRGAAEDDVGFWSDSALMLLLFTLYEFCWFRLKDAHDDLPAVSERQVLLSQCIIKVILL